MLAAAFFSLAFTREWRALGWKVVLATPEPCSALHRVALACRADLHCRPVSLTSTVAATRHAAALVEGTANSPDAKRKPVLLTAAYGFSGDLVKANAMMDELAQAFRAFGGPFVMLGDMNQTADEGTLASLVRCSMLRLLDDAFPVQLCHTNPTRSRRIDFGVSDSSLFPKNNLACRGTV